MIIYLSLLLCVKPWFYIVPDFDFMLDVPQGQESLYRIYMLVMIHFSTFSGFSPAFTSVTPLWLII